MGKFESLERDIFSIFDSTAWKSENIKTFPSNFKLKNSGEEFVRITILPSSKGLNRVSAAGLVIADIFTAAGNGPRRASTIADKLDKYLSGKSLQTGTGTTQFVDSSLSHKGADKDNPTLYMSSYVILFNFFGVS